MNFFFEVFRGLGETLLEISTGGEEARENFIKRSELRTRAYEICLKFWNEIVSVVYDAGRDAIPMGPDSPLVQEFLIFRNSIMEVFDDFEVDVNYNRTGIFEKAGESLGRLLAQQLTSTDPVLRELEYEFEQFWINFFKLKRRAEDTEAPSKTSLMEESLVEESVTRLAQDMKDAIQESGTSWDDVAALKTKFNDALNKVTAGEFNLEKREEVILKLAHDLAPDLAYHLAEQLTKSLNHEVLLEVAPGIKDLVLATFMVEIKEVNDTLSVYLGGLVASDLLPPGTDLADLANILETDPDFAANLATELETNSLLVQLLTGQPDWAKDEVYIEKTVSQFIQIIQANLLKLEMLSREVSGESDKLLKESAARLSTVFPWKIAIRMEPKIRRSIFRWLRRSFSGSFVHDVGANLDYLGFFIDRDVAWEFQKEMSKICGLYFLDTYKSFASETFNKDSIALFENFQSRVNDEVGMLWDDFWGDGSRSVGAAMLAAAASETGVDPGDSIRIPASANPELVEEYLDNLKNLSETLGDELAAGIASLFVYIPNDKETEVKDAATVVARNILQELVEETARDFAQGKQETARTILKDSLIALIPADDSEFEEQMRTKIDYLLIQLEADVEGALMFDPLTFNEAYFQYVFDDMGIEGLEAGAMPETLNDYLLSQATLSSIILEFWHSRGIAETLGKQLYEKMQAHVRHDLKVRFTNEIRKYFPDFTPDQEFDMHYNYAKNSPNWVIQHFFTNLQEVIRRYNNQNV